jgi:hypothetical protein
MKRSYPGILMVGLNETMKTSDRLVVLAKMQSTHHTKTSQKCCTCADVISILG